MQRSRAASAGSAARGRRCVGQRHRVVDRQRLGQRLGAPWARARLRPGWRRPAPSRPEPAVEAAPGRQHERDAARRQAGAVQLRRPAAHVVRLRLAQRHAAACGAKRCRRVEGLAVQRQRARREAALDREVLRGSAAMSASRAAGAIAPRVASAVSRQQRASAPRSRPRRCAPGTRCPCRRCSASGRASRAPAGRRRRRWRSWRSGISAIDTAARRLVEPLHRLEAGVDAAVRRAQAGGEAPARRRSTPLRERQRRERARRTPQTRIAACGIRNSCCSSRTSTSGRSRGVGGEHQRARPAMQPVGDGHVLLAVADHLDDLLLEALDLVAQHFHLPLLQRHRALAVRAGELHAGRAARHGARRSRACWPGSWRCRLR